MNVSEIIKKAEKLSNSGNPEESNALLGNITSENITEDEYAAVRIVVGRNYYLMKDLESAKEVLYDVIKRKDVSTEIRLIASKMLKEYGKSGLNPTVSRVGTL